ncbi:hypothetical protein E2C01_054501 [Portunus trituberculatus]|uniref:Uncharacterized protein n=1 Tax=Portunus trituberculatus TaxID=210409 RepID=A0A5B7GS52_PORTR|nr:hypothetical protein [Portunus trituberculatus]
MTLDRGQEGVGGRSIHSASITILTTTAAAAAAIITTTLSQQHIFVRQSGAAPRLTHRRRVTPSSSPGLTWTPRPFTPSSWHRKENKQES